MIRNRFMEMNAPRDSSSVNKYVDYLLDNIFDFLKYQWKVGFVTPYSHVILMPLCLFLHNSKGGSLQCVLFTNHFITHT